MGGLMSRNKGKRAEREIIELLQPFIDKIYEEFNIDTIKLKRNTMQSDGGGFDLHGMEWMAPEVKHQEVYNLEKWWEQTKAQAGIRQVPILFYRRNRVQWRVRMRAELHIGDGWKQWVCADISIEEFILYFCARLRHELRTKVAKE